MRSINNYLQNHNHTHWNLSPEELTDITLKNEEGVLSDTGALMCDTGEFTGRSPKDRYIVKDSISENAVWWGNINIPIEEETFENLYEKVLGYLEDKKLYVRDAYACADDKYRLNIRVVNTLAWHNLFCYNMFLRFEEENPFDHQDFTIINAPNFKADPAIDGVKNSNFSIISIKHRIILIGGTGYTGEMKKGIFSVLNFILPHDKNILSMHCSANMGNDGDAAIFFGLSGTGKTTLSADENRQLIGDDEHGWAKESVFNFEGGCYAKTINLTQEKEPEIFDAIKKGAILENTRFYPGSNKVNYEDNSITENTRVSYPIHHIHNAILPSIGAVPNNVFFLTCDAYGVLPPIAKLNKEQAMYHFISGYTAKVAGTEEGITEPKAVFSACFGEPFLPLPPTKYAEMLGDKMEKNEVNIWLINTGWTGGPYGTGERISLKFTRKMISEALEGNLNNAETKTHPVFRVEMITKCDQVPDQVLDPISSWEDKEDYFKTANKLAEAFQNNFKKFESLTSNEIKKGEPVIFEYA